MSKPTAPTHTAVGRIEVDGTTYQDGAAVTLSEAQAASLEARGAAVPIAQPQATKPDAKATKA